MVVMNTKNKDQRGEGVFLETVVVVLGGEAPCSETRHLKIPQDQLDEHVVRVWLVVTAVSMNRLAKNNERNVEGQWGCSQGADPWDLDRNAVDPWAWACFTGTRKAIITIIAIIIIMNSLKIWRTK
jgi:hypothetical protein